MTNRGRSSRARETLPLDREGPVPLYLQVRDALQAEVRAGRLAPGTRLPSVRDLARRLRLNVNTVVHAYRLLEEEGTVEAHAAKGTFVRGGAPGRIAPPPAAPLSTARPPRAIPAVAAPHAAPDGAISLATGTPDPALFPFEAVRRLVGEALDEAGPALLQYAAAEGDPALRAAAAALLAEAGVAAAPDDLLVTTGAQQGIDLVARALVADGDAVVVEAPTYPGALESLERAGARLVPVPMTPRGPDPRLLAEAVERHRPRLVYTVPTFHNPTGWTMNAAGRAALVDLAARAGAYVLEDDHVADLAFDGPPPPALAALDRAGRVIHVRGFAKTVLPGLRLAVVAAPPEVRVRLLALKLAADLYPPPLEQWVLARFLAGEYAAHVARLRPAYRARRDAALARLAGTGLDIVPPGGGLNLWAGLPAGVSAEAFEREGLVAGVAVAPGGLFHPDRRAGDRFVRISYGSVDEATLAEGLARLRAALDRVGRAGAPAAPLASAIPLV
jgi:2-aminoadipate transaminase